MFFTAVCVLLIFTFLSAIFFRPFRLSLVPTICPLVSEDASYHVKHYLRHVSERLDENKIKFFYLYLKFYCLVAVLKGVLFRKPFACA